MKKSTLLILIAFCTLGSFCNKENSDPPPPPPPVEPTPVDTLGVGWSKIVTSGKDGFADIFFQNNLTGYAIGKSLYKTVNGGVTWDSILSLNSRGGLNLSVTLNGTVYFVDNETDSNVFKSTNGGNSFVAVDAKMPKLYDVFFVNDNIGFCTSNTPSGRLLRTKDAGATWVEVLSSNSGIPYYSSLFFISTDSGWVSFNDRLYRYNASLNVLTKSNGTYGDISSIFAVSEDVVYACTRNGDVFKSVDRGQNFSFIKYFPNEGAFVDVHFISDRIGYVAANHKIYKTTDGGASWTTEVTIINSMIVELHFTDASHGWACGTNGLLLRFVQ